MKAVMISIKPQWVEKILSGEKTIEVRKTAPNLKTPFKCYIYCTSVKGMPLNEYVDIHRKSGGAVDCWHGKVVAEFVCNKIDRYVPILFKGQDYYQGYLDEEYRACVSHKELVEYGKGKTVYGWHISDLKIYDEPKELGEFSLYEKKDCDHFWCGICGERTQNDVINCKNLVCEQKTIKRPPQSWFCCNELEEV